jgi:hypothetical protein
MCVCDGSATANAMPCCSRLARQFVSDADVMVVLALHKHSSTVDRDRHRRWWHRSVNEEGCVCERAAQTWTQLTQ